MAELVEAARAEDRALRHLEAARGRRTQLLAAMQRLMRLEPAETRAHWNGRIQQAAARPERGNLARARDDRLTEVYAFLTWWEREVFRTADLTAHLEAEGFELAPTYAANCCKHLAQKGMVTKTGHGIYTINRTHPVMVEVQLGIISSD
ncbi:MAG: hypothetical protein AAF968_19340 [Pseudomonadota bacterium]